MGEVPRAVGEDPCKPVLYESPSGRLGSWTVGQRPMDSCAACAVAVFMYCAELGEGGYTLRCEGGTLFSVPWSHATTAVHLYSENKETSVLTLLVSCMC